MGKFVGIDLGTTYSVIAYINENGKPEVIPNAYGRSLTPSVIYFGGGAPVIGDEAKERQEAGETEIASFFKRNLDDSSFLLSFHGHDYSAVDLSALVLGYLKQQAENFFGEPVTDAVITVPAYFDHHRRLATMEAGRKVGLNVLKIINEPTAASLAYGLRPGAQESGQTVLVCDLGGGTFDISLIHITTNELNVIAIDGDHNLGGKDWDDRLLEYLETQFEQEFGVELLGQDLNELHVQSERLKRSLSVRQSASIHVQAAGHVATYTITREQFENLTGDLMARIKLLTTQVLEKAGLTWKDVNGILPVGGSTKMPMITDYIKMVSGKPPMSGINPDEAVGLGAAIQAAIEIESRGAAELPAYRLAGRKKVVDVIAHSLGLIVENADRTQYINSIIIQKNMAIPTKQTRPYQKSIRRRKKTELEVFLTQGENSDPQDCSYLGRYVFSDFPPTREKMAIVDITYAYDENGIVQVSAVEQASRKPLSLTVYPVPSDVPGRFRGRPIDMQEREPLAIYLAFDVSGSMYMNTPDGTPLDQAKRAAEKFVSECDLNATSIGLIAFSDRVHIEQTATSNRAEILSALSRLPSVNTGVGNYTDPFDEILRSLTNAPGIRYAIVLADGVWAYQDEAIRKAKRCHEDEIEIIAIGFGQANQGFLRRIASSSEQSFFIDISQLSETFSTIAQELSGTGGSRQVRGGIRLNS